jgi:hypothetical protein
MISFNLLFHSEQVKSLAKGEVESRGGQFLIYSKFYVLWENHAIALYSIKTFHPQLDRGFLPSRNFFYHLLRDGPDVKELD